MPSLDRLITLGIQGPDGNEDGRPVPGEIVDHDVWARQLDFRFEVTRGGATELTTERRYRVRYTPEVYEAFLSNGLSVVTGGRRYQVATVVEVERRKWLDVSVFLPVS